MTCAQNYFSSNICTTNSRGRRDRREKRIWRKKGEKNIEQRWRDGRDREGRCKR
jgi:hypothetical protein